MNDSISIIMSTYNDDKYIRESVLSLFKQTYKNWELIVIDDHSTDNTYNILKELQKNDNRIKYYSNKKNRGLVFNLLQGVKLAKGNFIARLDSDDIWTNSKKLERQYRFLSIHQNYSLVGTLGNAIDEKGEIIYKLKYPTTNAGIRKRILSKNCFIHSSVMFKKNYYKKAGGYDRNQNNVEDYDLWLKMGTFSKFANINQNMVHLRIRKGSITQKYFRHQTEMAIRLIKKFKKYYPNFYMSYLLWHFRKLYLTSDISRLNKIRNFISI